jgi:hypothetical protein
VLAPPQLARDNEEQSCNEHKESAKGGSSKVEGKTIGKMKEEIH